MKYCTFLFYFLGLENNFEKIKLLFVFRLYIQNKELYLYIQKR